MKPLLVGELNPYGSDPRYALFPWPRNSSAYRLMKIMGMRAVEYLRTFDRVNLCTKKWDREAAQEKAIDLMHDWCHEPEKVLVLLGAKVKAAFGFKNREFFTIATVFEHSAVLLPHPSGLCRTRNDPHAIDRARLILHKAEIVDYRRLMRSVK